MMACRLLAKLLIAPFAATFAASATSAFNDELLLDKPPLRVFVLAGQSNMVGHGTISEIDDSTGHQRNATLEWMVRNVPDQYGFLQQQLEDRVADDSSVRTVEKQEGEAVAIDETRVGGTVRVRSSKAGKAKKKQSRDSTKWTVRSDVLIACNSRVFDDLDPTVTEFGNLYPGLCAGEPAGPPQLGPELGFGWAVGDAFNHGAADDDSKVLLLKVSWGGKSLAVDFRPPSSGGDTGPNYKSMIENVMNTIPKIQQLFPKESEGRPIQLSGFAWHQGWNDGCNETQSEDYESNLANLIRDVRKDLRSPDLPFAIAATGMNGYDNEPTVDGLHPRQEIVDAELKVATYPEFRGNVASVDTRPFARGAPPASPSEQIYHWYRNAESYWLVGQSLGEAMVRLVHQKEQGQLAELSQS